MIAMEERLMSIEEICEYLGFSIYTIYAWVKKEKIPCHKVGRLLKFRKNEIDEWVSKQ